MYRKMFRMLTLMTNFKIIKIGKPFYIITKVFNTTIYFWKTCYCNFVFLVSLRKALLWYFFSLSFFFFRDNLISHYILLVCWTFLSFFWGGSLVSYYILLVCFNTLIYYMFLYIFYLLFTDLFLYLRIDIIIRPFRVARGWFKQINDERAYSREYILIIASILVPISLMRCIERKKRQVPLLES